MKSKPLTRWRDRLRRSAALDGSIARHPSARGTRPGSPTDVQYYDPHGSPVSEATAKAIALRDPLSWRTDFQNRTGVHCWIVTRWRADLVAPYATSLYAGPYGQLKGRWPSRTRDQAEQTHHEVHRLYKAAK